MYTVLSIILVDLLISSLHSFVHHSSGSVIGMDKSNARGSTDRNIHFTISQVNSFLHDWVCFATNGNFAIYIQVVYVSAGAEKLPPLISSISYMQQIFTDTKKDFDQGQQFALLCLAPYNLYIYIFFVCVLYPALTVLWFTHSSGAVWESRWPSWAVRPNEPSGFRGRKAILNHASALVSVCP